MSVHRFETTHLLPISRDEAWRFFSNPRNLARITPPEMGFGITSDVPEEVYHTPGSAVPQSPLHLGGRDHRDDQ